MITLWYVSHNLTKFKKKKKKGKPVLNYFIFLCISGDGNWAQWIQWGCSVTCGVGISIRNRTCTDPAPWGNGANCFGWDITEHFYQHESCDTSIECPGRLLSLCDVEHKM